MGHPPVGTGICPGPEIIIRPLDCETDSITICPGDDPIPVTFSGGISVNLDCSTDSITICPGDDPIVISGTVELGATTLAALETITVLQGTSPWVIGDGGGSITVDGTITVNQGTSPWVIGDGGGSITIDGSVSITGTVAVTQSTSPWVTSLDAPTLAALENITVQNPGGAGAVNIQDGGNSITVDGAVTVSGTVTADTNFDYPEDSVHVSGDSGAFVLAVRNDAGTPLAADGDYIPFTTDSSGSLRVTIAGGSSVTQTGRDDTDNQAAVATGLLTSVDRNYVWDSVGGNWDRWTGAVTQGTSPWVVSGTVTVNQGTSPWVIGDGGGSITVDGTVTVTQGTSPWVVSGTVAATQSGSWNVTILNGAGAAAVNIQDGGNSITVDGSVSISGTVTVDTNFDYAEDSPHVSGDVGAFVLAVRNDANAAFTNTNGDYSPIAVNSAGAVAISDGGNSITVDGSVSITGTVAVTQSTSPWVVSGTVTVNQGTSPWVVSGTVATNSERAEDSGHTSGQIGNFVLAVRNDTAAVLTSTDLDYSPFAVDSSGRMGISDLGGSISIDDNGGSITVDGTVAISGTVAVTQSTSPWVVSGTVTVNQGTSPWVVSGTVSATTNFSYPEDSAHVSGDPGAFVLAVRNDANAAFTNNNGDYSPIAVNSAGAVAISDGGNSITVDGTVAVSSVGGTVAVTQSTSPWVVSGTVSAAQSGAWSVTILNGSGAAAVNIQDGGNSITVDGAVTVSGTVATNSERAEDSGHTSGQIGNFVLGVRNDTASVLTSTDLDYSPFATDSAGRIGISDLGGAISIDDNGGSITVDGTVAATQSGAWNVTVLNGSGAAAVNIQDGGNSITVDGTVSISGTVTVDTELPAASALADADANPTTSRIGSNGLVFNGTTWDRARSVQIGDNPGVTGIPANLGYVVESGTIVNRIRQFPTSDGVANTGFQGVGIMVTAAAGATSNRLRDPSTDAIGVGLIADGNMGFNGTNWDRIRSGGDDTDNQTAISLGVIKTIGRNYVWDAGGSNWDRWTGAITGTVSISGTVAVTQSTSPWVVSGTVTADTELPAASALADADANPTTSRIGSNLLGYNGTTWDRIRSVGNNADGVTVTTLGNLAVDNYNMVFNGTTWDRVRSGTATGSVLVNNPTAANLNVTVAQPTGTITNGAETAVAGTAVQILASNANRKKYFIQNTGTANIRVGVSGVTATTGVRLVPSGTILMEMPNCPTQAIFAIREGATSSIAFAQEIT